jgi:DNA-binding NarL/FixJ family response regulator
MHGSSGQGPGETIASLTTTLRSLSVIIFSDLDGTDSMMAAFDNGAWLHSDGEHDVAIAVEAIRPLGAGGIFLSASSLQMITYPPATPESTRRASPMRSSWTKCG